MWYEPSSPISMTQHVAINLLFHLRASSHLRSFASVAIWLMDPLCFLHRHAANPWSITINHPFIDYLSPGAMVVIPGIISIECWMKRSIQLLKQITLIEIISTCSAAGHVVVDSRVFHAVDSATLTFSNSGESASYSFFYTTFQY